MTALRLSSVSVMSGCVQSLSSNDSRHRYLEYTDGRSKPDVELDKLTKLC